MATEKRNSIGIAYGFFYCDASIEEIEKELPTIRELVGTPSQLELSLMELHSVKDINKFKEDKELTVLIEDAERCGINYLLSAQCKGKTNENVAEELASILNQAYQSPLYHPKEPFNGAIVYQSKVRGDYLFRN